MVGKNEIINKMASKGYTKKDAEIIMKDFTSVITEFLVGGDSVQFRGFGTFSVREAAPRKTTDYQTKEKIMIPGRMTPKFTPGKLLKEAVRSSDRLKVQEE